MALMLPTAYISDPHGTSRRTVWYTGSLNRCGVKLAAVVPTDGVAALTGAATLSMTAVIAADIPAARANRPDNRIVPPKMHKVTRQRTPTVTGILAGH